MGPAVGLRIDASIPYRRDTIVPSTTARTPTRSPALGAAAPTAPPVALSAASARIGFHTVSEPLEEAAACAERSPERWPRRMGMT